MRFVTTLKDEKTTLTTHISSVKNMQKLSYLLVIIF